VIAQLLRHVFVAGVPLCLPVRLAVRSTGVQSYAIRQRDFSLRIDHVHGDLTPAISPVTSVTLARVKPLPRPTQCRLAAAHATASARGVV
jgi:hypothetical protein